MVFAYNLRGQISSTQSRQRSLNNRSRVSVRTIDTSKSRCQAVVVASALSPALQQKCDDWLALEADSGRREAAQSWFASCQEAELQEAVGQRLIFGMYIPAVLHRTRTGLST